MLTTIKHNILATLFLIIFIGLNVSNANARVLQTNDIYTWAKNGNTRYLWHYKKYIDIVDKNGNTAYCIALKHKEINVANFLVRFGANTNHTCVSQLSQQKTFLGMGKTGWAITGGALAIGGIAAAAGGGGGGGGMFAEGGGGGGGGIFAGGWEAAADCMTGDDPGGCGGGAATSCCLD